METTSDSTAPSGTDACPVSGFPGERVEWLTVAALTAGPVPPRQEFWLCRDPACDAVYFGSAGATVSRAELTVEPGFKAGSTGLVCYCFHHRRHEIARDIAASGHTQVIDALRAKIQAGQCACKIRNPSGKCCLGEVQQAVHELLSCSRTEI